VIAQLDGLLRHLFMTRVNGLSAEEQVGFQPPDEEWRTAVRTSEQSRLNIYLADLRENRKLRSNERMRSLANGAASEEPAPARLDCHYLISAWSPAQQTPGIEPTVDEHALLYAVTAALVNSAPLNPARIYGEKPEAAQAWGAFWEVDLPTQVLPAEGFPKLAEFWGVMGANNRWKPVVYLVVTLPVAAEAVVAGPLVTAQVLQLMPIAETDS
jgi:hypothetical protein